MNLNIAALVSRCVLGCAPSCMIFAAQCPTMQRVGCLALRRGVSF